MASKESEKSFFCQEAVGEGGRSPIEIRFEALIYAHCQKPSQWYKELKIDKADASKIRRGLFIPPKWQRIKIAQYFKTDSLNIWGELSGMKETLIVGYIEGVPEVLCFKHDFGLKFWCKYCSKWHLHGFGDGHRGAHCHEYSPFKEKGYYLREVDYG